MVRSCGEESRMTQENEPDDLGLRIDMLDVDRLRDGD